MRKGNRFCTGAPAKCALWRGWGGRELKNAASPAPPAASPSPFPFALEGGARERAADEASGGWRGRGSKRWPTGQRKQAAGTTGRSGGGGSAEEVEAEDGGADAVGVGEDGGAARISAGPFLLDADARRHPHLWLAPPAGETRGDAGGAGRPAGGGAA
jgi:hypothetical protein